MKPSNFGSIGSKVEGCSVHCRCLCSIYHHQFRDPSAKHQYYDGGYPAFQTTRSTAFAWMSPGASLEQLGDVIFRIQPRYDLSPAVAALAVIALIAASAYVLARRVKGVEIVT